MNKLFLIVILIFLIVISPVYGAQLEVTLDFPNTTHQNPSTPLEVNFTDTFWVNGTITCTGSGLCGDIWGSVRYNSSGTVANKRINRTSDTPFHLVNNSSDNEVVTGLNTTNWLMGVSTPIGDELRYYIDESGGWTEVIVADFNLSITAVRIGDADNDGNNEIVAGIEPTTNELRYYKNESGGWTEVNITDVGSVYINSIDIGDADNDGINEIVVGLNSTDNELRMYKNESGGWTEYNISDVDNHIRGVAIGDLDNDGTNEIAVAIVNSEYDIRYYKNESGSWNEVNVSNVEGDGARDVTIGDADSDSKNEIIVGYMGVSNELRYYKNESGGWTEVIVYDLIDYPSRVRVGDANNDGRNEICTVLNYSSSYEIQCFVNESGGWLQINVDSALLFTFDLAIGDATNDGWIGIVVAAAGLDQSTRYYENRTGSWLEYTVADVITDNNDLDIGDVDNDAANMTYTNPFYCGLLNTTSGYNTCDFNFTIEARGPRYTLWALDVNATSNLVSTNNSTNVYVNITGEYPPYWSNNQSYTPIYSPIVNPSEFNITWINLTDESVDTVFIEQNWTNPSWENLTMTNDTYGGNIYTYSAILPAGVFCWSSYANTTYNKWNRTTLESPWCFNNTNYSSDIDAWDQEYDYYSGQPNEGKPAPPAGYSEHIVNVNNSTYFWVNYTNSSDDLIIGNPVSDLALEINNSWRTLGGETRLWGIQVFDIDNDNIDEIIVNGYVSTGTEEINRSAEITIWNITNSQFYLEANITWRMGENETGSQGVSQPYDIDSDGIYEIISTGYYYNNATSVGFGEITIWNITNSQFYLEANTTWNNFNAGGTWAIDYVIEDIDNDSVTEIVVIGTTNASVYEWTGYHGRAEITIWNLTNGVLMMETNTSWDTLEGNASGARKGKIADIDNDTYPEIIVAGYTNNGDTAMNDSSEVTVWNVSGGTINLQANRIWQTWSEQDTGLRSIGVGDIDNDEVSEIVVGGYARVNGISNGFIEWTVFNYNYTSDSLIRKAHLRWTCCDNNGGTASSIEIFDIDDDGTNEIISTATETTGGGKNTGILIILNKSDLYPPQILKIEDYVYWRYYDEERTYSNAHFTSDIDRDGTLEIIGGGHYEELGVPANNFSAALRIYNYSNSVCKIQFNDTQFWYEMIVNQTNNLFQLNRSFNSCGFYVWNISCNKISSPYSPLSYFSNVTICPSGPTSPGGVSGDGVWTGAPRTNITKEEQPIMNISMPSNLTIYENESGSFLLNITRLSNKTCCVNIRINGISQEWILTNLGAFSIEEGETKSFNITLTSDESGEYSLDITVSSPDFEEILPFKLIVLEEGRELEPKCKVPWWLVIPIELEYPECYIPTWMIVLVGVLYWGYKHQRKYKQPPKKPSFWKRFKRKHKKIKIKETRRRPRRKSKKSKKKKYSWKIFRRKPKKKKLPKLTKKEKIRIIEQRLRERA